MQHINKELADKLVALAVKQYRVAFEFKKGRMEDIRKNEDFYYGRKINVPIGEFGVPLPTMAGFVDTLMSKIDDPPTINFNYEDLADLKISQKTSALFLKDSKPTRNNWPQKDRWEKKLACFSGVGISELYAESDPKYKSVYRVVDHEDFLVEPAGGGNLDETRFHGEDNVFRSKNDLLSGAKTGLYDKTQVALLADRMSSESFDKNEDLHKGKANRLAKLGLQLEGNQYIGQPMFRLVKWYMEYEGEKYYLVFDYLTKVWIRAHILKDVFSINKTPWTAWQTHEDAFNFFSKAPCDDMRPIADSIDTLWNQVLTNRAKKNSGQRAYDPDIFPDPSELEWRPHGLARATAIAKGRQIKDGIYEFQVGDIGTTVDLITYLDMFGGRKTGIAPESEGAQDPEKQKVGIFFGRLQQMADRLGLYNKSYRENWERKGLRYAWGIYDHLNEKEAVKIIGEQGVEWDEITKGEAKKAPDLDIEIKGGSAELEANAQKKQERKDAQVIISKDPLLAGQINPRWRAEEVLKLGEYDEEQLKRAFSPEDINLEVLSNASQAIQDIVAGKKPKMYRTATTAFIQRIVDFATDKEVKMDIFRKLMQYAMSHLPMAQENMERSTRKIITQKRLEPTQRPKQQIAEGVRTEEPIAGTPATTSPQRASNILQGKGSPAPAI